MAAKHTNSNLSTLSNRVNQIWSRDRIDVIAAILGALLGIVISLLNLIYSNEYMIIIGPMLIIICLAYVLFRRRLLAPAPEPKASQTLLLMANIIFWLSFAGSIYSLSNEVLHRPLIYFILTSLATSMIALEILYSRSKSATALILFQILLVSLSIRASAFWVLPTLPGSDPWGHANYVNDFLSLEQIASTHGDIYYTNFPIMHLNVAAMSLIVDADTKTAMFLGASLPLLLSTIFVFLIGRRLANVKVGLLGALLINIGDFHLQWSIQVIAMSLGIALFTLIVYLALSDRSTTRLSTFVIVIVIVLMVELVITHTVSAFIMLCFLLFFLIGMLGHRFLFKPRRKLSSQDTLITPWLVGAFALVLVAYWSYADYTAEGGSFLYSCVSWLFEALTQRAGFLERPAAATADFGYLGPILNIAGFLVLYSLGTLGCLIWFSRRHQNRTRFALVVTLLLLTAVAFTFPVFGLRNILPYRWYAFIYVPLSIVSAYAILSVIRHVGHRKLQILVLACMVFATSFFMITNRISNMDSPVYAAELNQRVVYTDSEMAIAGHLVEVYDGRIIADFFYGNTVLGVYLTRSGVSYDMNDRETVDSGVVVWRGVMAERPIQTNHAIMVLGTAYEQNLAQSHNIIYINNASKAFLAKVD